MPDFDIQVHFHCRTVEDYETTVPSSKPGKSYRVWVGRAFWEGAAQFDWHCECSGFKFRKTCSHVKLAKQSREYCGWQGFIEGEDPIRTDEGEWKCPRCGDEAFPLRYAV